MKREESVITGFTRRNFSGAFGDIGIFFPICAALIAINGVNPTSLFVTAGLLYLASGFFFRIPMPVQPLKAVSIIAIALQLDATVVTAAALIMGVILLLMAVSGLAEVLSGFFNQAIVRGIQLALGLMLAREGFLMVMRGNYSLTLSQSVACEPGAITLMLAAASGMLLIFFYRSNRFPGGLALVSLGVGVGLGLNAFNIRISLGPVLPHLILPTWSQLEAAFFLLVIPQVALTFGNAVVATRETAKLLFGERAERVNCSSLSFSMGIANVLGGLLGSVPFCHGSGGLTAHQKLGATSKESNYIIGSFYLILGLLFGGAAVSLMTLIPGAVLGVLLIFVGIQHGLFIRDIVAKIDRLAIAVLVALVAFWTGNISVGFGLGFAVQAFLAASGYLWRWSRKFAFD